MPFLFLVSLSCKGLQLEIIFNMANEMLFPDMSESPFPAYPEFFKEVTFYSPLGAVAHCAHMQITHGGEGQKVF